MILLSLDPLGIPHQLMIRAEFSLKRDANRANRAFSLSLAPPLAPPEPPSQRYKYPVTPATIFKSSSDQTFVNPPPKILFLYSILIFY